ncbi:hypothetical protein Tco_0504832 [Tanacetum coccineum]
MRQRNSTWMAFGGNTERGDGIASIKRHCRDLQSDDVKDFVTASERSRLKEDLESSMWRRRHGFKATARRTLVILAAFRPFLRPQNPIVTDLNPCFNQSISSLCVCLQFSLTILLFIMENANPSSSTPNSKSLHPKKKLEIRSWLEDSKIVDTLVSSDDVAYFDTFPTLEELGYHEWLLKYPKLSWVRAKIRTGDLNHIKISCMIGHFLKRQGYIDLESPTNVMSKHHYKWIMS